jgi:hypothetical protein
MRSSSAAIGLARPPTWSRWTLQPGDTVESIMERLHPLEHRMLAGGIMRWVYERQR